MEDTARSGVDLVGLLGEVAQVGHHVVPGAALQLRHPVEVEVAGPAAQRRDLLLGDGEAELALAFGERDPQPAPLLEAVAGVQWDSCCLAVRALVRRYVRNREGDLNNSLQVEFVLKGLGSAGQNTERTLRRAILGYYRDDLYLVPPSNTTPDPDDNDSGPY